MKGGRKLKKRKERKGRVGRKEGRKLKKGKERRGRKEEGS